MVGREVDGPPCAVLGRFWTYVGGLGALLGPMLAVLGRSWALMGGLEPLLGPLCPVLGCSWSPCWRSWAALGPYVGGLGPLLGPVLAVLGRLGPKNGQGRRAQRSPVSEAHGKNFTIDSL